MIAGQKWGANLWVWNGPRAGMYSVPRDDAPVEQVVAHFSTVDVPEAELFWKDMSWGRLPIHGEEAPIGSSTFPGHEWDIRVNGVVVGTWTISADEAFQEFVLRRADIDAELYAAATETRESQDINDEEMVDEDWESQL